MIRRMMFEAADAEEAEIINRHLGKWGDRIERAKTNDSKDRKGGFGDFSKDRKGGPSSRDERRDSRDSRQAERKSFFSGRDDQRKSFDGGRRDSRDERRPRRDGEKPARKFDGQKGGGRPFQGKRDKK